MRENAFHSKLLVLRSQTDIHEHSVLAHRHVTARLKPDTTYSPAANKNFESSKSTDSLVLKRLINISVACTLPSALSP